MKSLALLPSCYRRSLASMFVLLLQAGVCIASDLSPAAIYRIGPKDLLEIKVFEVPELNLQARVGEDGAVSLPLIGSVPVQGLSDGEAAERLKVLLEAKYVQRASVTVQVREFRSKPISVVGAVRQAGNLAFSGRWTLLEAIAAAGGLTDEHGDKIYIRRHAENGIEDQIAVIVEDLTVLAKPEVNIPLFANDFINVPANITLTVYCMGEVASQGAVAFKSNERISVLTAIAKAGGLTDRASRSIKIQRRNPDGRSVEIVVDYKRILSGKDNDPTLQNGDIVVVKESFF